MDFNPDVRLADGQTVRGDGWEIEAIHTPGHASNHLCFALKGRDVLFAGDHVMGWSTTLVSPPDGDMGQYIASLRKLLGRPERTFIPGHGDPIDDPAALVSRVLNRRLERRGEIMQCVRSGASTITAVLNELYVGLNPKLARAARSTVFAHLIELVEAGCAVTDGRRTRTAAFARPDLEACGRRAVPVTRPLATAHPPPHAPAPSPLPTRPATPSGERSSDAAGIRVSGPLHRETAGCHR